MTGSITLADLDTAPGDPDVPWPEERDNRAATPSPARAFRELSLAALVRDGVPPPDLLCGDLIYAGGLHSIAGPPDCGKTTIALWWALRHVRAGHTVVFLDEEGGAELVAEKLIALNATPEDAERIRYYPFPARSWNPCDVIVLRELLDDVKPSLVLWDSSAAFLSRAGLDENSASDVTRFWSQVLTPIAREHGAAVLVIDHDTKDGITSRFARGSGAKLAACDVAFKVAIGQPFSRTQNGVLKMAVSKDRRGWLHRSWEIVVETGSGMTLRFTELDEDEDGCETAQKLTPADKKTQAALTETPSTTAEITDQIAAQHGHGLKRQTLSESLNKLLRRGVADKLDRGAGRPALWCLANTPKTAFPQVRPVSGDTPPENAANLSPAA
jgi:AAA domain-containing protein